VPHILCNEYQPLLDDDENFVPIHDSSESTYLNIDTRYIWIMESFKKTKVCTKIKYKIDVNVSKIFSISIQKHAKQFGFNPLLNRKITTHLYNQE